MIGEILGGLVVLGVGYYIYTVVKAKKNKGPGGGARNNERTQRR